MPSYNNVKLLVQNCTFQKAVSAPPLFQLETTYCVTSPEQKCLSFYCRFSHHINHTVTVNTITSSHMERTTSHLEISSYYYRKVIVKSVEIIHIMIRVMECNGIFQNPWYDGLSRDRIVIPIKDRRTNYCFDGTLLGVVHSNAVDYRSEIPTICSLVGFFGVINMSLNFITGHRWLI